MKALSIRQPWAHFIINGFTVKAMCDIGNGFLQETSITFYKDVENRSWKLPKLFHLPQRVYIHASKIEDTLEIVAFIMGRRGGELDLKSLNLVHGAIIGEVDIVDCVTESNSAWFTGHYGFILANPIAYSQPIPCRGALGFFTPDIDFKPALTH